MKNKKRKETTKYIDAQYWSTTLLMGDELVDRTNIWHFNYFVAESIVPLLEDFLDVAEFKVADRQLGVDQVRPEKYVNAEDFENIISAINLLARYHDEGGLIYNGKDINFERGDFILELNDALHKFANILPYLNDRHFNISQELYEDAPYGRQRTLDELRKLDKTIAKRIFPTLRAFAEMSIFTPRYFTRMFYAYPMPDSNRTKNYNSFDMWKKALETMVESWQWILERKPMVNNEGFEEVPEKIYYGLHLFAEYLPEMQND